jgi:Leucine-rich repeat (LRR) protein
MVNKFLDRIEFLAEKFDVFDTNPNELDKKLEEITSANYEYKLITGTIDETPLAIVWYVKYKESNNLIAKKVSVSLDVFSDIISSDPTPNKSCVQWMLTVFTRYLKSNKPHDIELAIRFVVEDLPQASDYLTLFEQNKRKVKFKDFCKHSYILKHVSDPTDINQYKSLSQLFDAVDPFIKRDPTEMESLLNRYVGAGKALIPVRDRKFTLYIPKTTDASTVFHKFANWCTAVPKNGMFTSYTNYLKPNGKKSDIYIIINNKFFTGESNELYQIHFESNQIKDRHNSSNVSIFESVINESEGISNFFYEELMEMAKGCKTGLNNNKYLDALIKFGFCESLFEFIEPDAPTIRFMTREIPRLPDMDKFTQLDQLIITGAKLVDLHPSIGNLSNLEMLVLADNRIKSLPKEIGNLKKLTFINLVGNPIEVIPDEIKYLDRSNGGSLFRLAVKSDDIGVENYQRLKELLPSTKF